MYVLLCSTQWVHNRDIVGFYRVGFYRCCFFPPACKPLHPSSLWQGLDLKWNAPRKAPLVISKRWFIERGPTIQVLRSWSSKVWSLTMITRYRSIVSKIIVPFVVLSDNMAVCKVLGITPHRTSDGAVYWCSDLLRHWNSPFYWMLITFISDTMPLWNMKRVGRRILSNLYVLSEVGGSLLRCMWNVECLVDRIVRSREREGRR